MNELILQGLRRGYTAYHLSSYLAETLQANGFVPLKEEEVFSLTKGGKYYVVRNGSALVAFVVGDLTNYQYKIVASHLDSPALKLKYNPVRTQGTVSTLNVEPYGGGIWSTFTDVPLKIAGRIVTEEEDGLTASLYTDPHTYVIPNVAIHMNRKANDGFVYDPQVDLAPLFGLSADGGYFAELDGKKVVGYDLFAVNGTQPFLSGSKDEFLCSPRLDNQLCALASLTALLSAKPEGVAVAFFADHEEVGSRTNEGAGSDFLKKTLKRINQALGFDRKAFDCAIARSFFLSADNAHATHPAHPELSDPTNKVELGGGVVVKHHANRNYTTDGLTSAVFDKLMASAKVKTQHFFMLSDLRCGSTLGTVSETQIAIPSVDIGVAQLAMHSSMETAAVSDVEALDRGLTAFYNAKFKKTDTGYRF